MPAREVARIRYSASMLIGFRLARAGVWARVLDHRVEIAPKKEIDAPALTLRDRVLVNEFVERGARVEPQVDRRFVGGEIGLVVQPIQQRGSLFRQFVRAHDAFAVLVAGNSSSIDLPK